LDLRLISTILHEVISELVQALAEGIPGSPLWPEQQQVPLALDFYLIPLHLKFLGNPYRLTVPTAKNLCRLHG
jgi:hypothetical protein